MINKKISKELQTLAWLSLPVLSSIEVERIAALLPKINFQRLETLITQHRTHPCVYHNIRQYFINEVPTNFSSQLKNKYNKNLTNNIKQLQICAKLKYLCQLDNILIHFFKGLSLSKAIYHDIALKHNKDIDAIISTTDIIPINNILNNMGFYAKTFDSLDEDWKKQYFKSTKDIKYSNNQGVIIEIHLRLSNNPIEQLEAYQKNLFSRKEIFQENLSLDEFFYLCWHGSHSLFHRLKWLVDLKLYSEQLEQKIEDSDYFSNNNARVIVSGLSLLSILYDTPLSEKAKTFYNTDLICRNMVKTCLQGLDNPKYTNSYLFNIKSHFFEITALKNVNYNITMLAKKFIPSEIDILTLKHLSTRWLFLYYPLRPFLAFKRKFLTK